MENSKIVMIDNKMYAQIRLYQYMELSEKSQFIALERFIKVVVECYTPNDFTRYKNLEKAVKDCNRMKTPWFIGQYVLEYCGDQIKEELQDNFFFTEDGIIFCNYEFPVD